MLGNEEKVVVYLPYANPHALGWIKELRNYFVVKIYCEFSVAKFRSGYFSEFDEDTDIIYKFKNKDFSELLLRDCSDAKVYLILGLFNKVVIRTISVTSKDVKVYVLSEPFNPVNSKRRLLVRSIYAFIIRLLKREINFLCIGGKAVKDYFQSLGFHKSKFYHFGYFPNYTKNGHSRMNSSERIRFLFVGQLIKRKGIDTLLNYIDFLDEFHKGKYEFQIVGDGILKTELKRKLIEKKSVSILGLINDPIELERIYDESDILFVPSNFDGWGAVVNEGIARGLAIIASNKTHAALSLVSGNGFVFDKLNMEELYLWTKNLFIDDKFLMRLKYSSSLVYDEWNHENAALSLNNLINESSNTNIKLLKPI